MSQRAKGLSGASLRLAPDGSGAATKIAGVNKRRVADTGGVPTAMEPLPNMQVSVSPPGRGCCQSQPPRRAAMITRIRHPVILIHSRHVALPTQAMSVGQVRGSIGSGSARRRR